MEKDFIFNWAILKNFVNFAQKIDCGGKQKRAASKDRKIKNKQGSEGLRRHNFKRHRKLCMMIYY